MIVGGGFVGFMSFGLIFNLKSSNKSKYEENTSVIMLVNL